jgi:hypothetical protein
MPGLARLFTAETQAVFFNYKEKPVSASTLVCVLGGLLLLLRPWPAFGDLLHLLDLQVQRMLDFDYVCGECERSSAGNAARCGVFWQGIGQAAAGRAVLATRSAQCLGHTQAAPHPRWHAS